MLEIPPDIWVAMYSPDSVFPFLSYPTWSLSPRRPLSSQPHSLFSSIEATNLIPYCLSITFTFHTPFRFLVYLFL